MGQRGDMSSKNSKRDRGDSVTNNTNGGGLGMTALGNTGINDLN